MATEKRLIDANTLMEHLTKCIEQSKGLMRSVCVAIKCFVEQMPTVEAVEVVQAHWLDIRYDSQWRYMKATCSHCMVRGEIRFKENTCGSAVPDSVFCPNCGAKMDGERENDGV